MPLAQLLAGPGAALPPTAAVNGLLDCQGPPEEAAAEAAALLRRQPYAALKIKVGRRADPLEDAAAVLAIRRAVGPTVALRADANRRWSLEQAVQVRAGLGTEGCATAVAMRWRGAMPLHAVTATRQFTILSDICFTCLPAHLLPFFCCSLARRRRAPACST